MHVLTSIGGTGETGPLEPKKWTQTPPPKPRPSNAQLPQQQVQPASAELSKPNAPQPQPPSLITEQLNPITPNFPQTQKLAAEKATAKALKFAPSKPSGLRNMTQMSPLQIQQEQESNKENMGDPRLEMLRSLEKEDMKQFSQEVIDAVLAQDDTIPEYPLPAELLAQMQHPWTEVEKATDRYFN